MQKAEGVGELGRAPRPLYPFAVVATTQRKEKNRGAHRDIYQKTTTPESPPRDESRNQSRGDEYFHRPNGESAIALRSLREAMLACAQYPERTGMARPIDATNAVNSALSTASGGVCPVWGAGGWLSLGGALGAGDPGTE